MWAANGRPTDRPKPRSVDRPIDRRAQMCTGFSGQPIQRVCSLDLAQVDRSVDWSERLALCFWPRSTERSTDWRLPWDGRPTGRPMAQTVRNLTVGWLTERSTDRSFLTVRLTGHFWLFWTPTTIFLDPYINGSLSPVFTKIFNNNFSHLLKCFQLVF